MNRRTLKALMLFLAAAMVMAPAAGAAAEAADVQAIQKIMQATWDKPEAPLKVAPVVVADDYALAGWLQGKTGGRALLRREHGQWKVIVCGGDGLLKAEALVQTGMPASTAKSLSRSAGAAETKLSPAVRKQLSLFDGIVRVDGGHDPRAAHQDNGHGAHDKAMTTPGKSPAAHRPH